MIQHNIIDEYSKIINKINSYDIMVQGFFMFGFDNDNNTVFKDTVRAIKELDIDDAIMYILTPYPGTSYFKEFENAGRILTYDWEKYSWWNCVFKPKNMSPSELEEGLRWSYEQINKYCKKNLVSRMWKYRKRMWENPCITIKLVKDYCFNKVDVAKLP